MRGRACIALAWAFATAGCAGPDRAAVPGSEAILLDPSGLRVAGTELEIGFGRSPDGAIAAVTQLVGTPPSRPLIEVPACGADVTVVTYPGGLSLTFADRMFTGWRYDGPPDAYRTADGATVGAPAATLSPAAGLAAETDSDGRIAAISAGAPCAPTLA
mgnify:CR=1 FL=1